MVKVLNYLFENWKKPIIILALSVILTFISDFLFSRKIGEFVFWFFLFSILLNIISIIYQLVKKEWLKSFATFGFICLILFSFIFYSTSIGFWIDQSKPDEFADEIEIPKNIKFESPLENRNGSKVELKKNKIDFQIYNSFQPRIYEYDFWSSKIEKGTIYLKAIEISENVMLSEERLKERSLLNIFNQNETIQKFKSVSDFTIYEGDWGKPYIARFEVWFKPENNGKERKLIEKNYKIEGWMR